MTDGHNDPAPASPYATTHRANLPPDMALLLPPPGPAHYAARRARWLAAPDTHTPPRRTPPSHARLQRLLSQPDPHSDPVWNRGIDQVWNGLSKGNRLKHRLPMSLVVRAPPTPRPLP